MTVSKAARLVSEGSYSIYNDNNDYDLLRKVLKVAFPKDEMTESFNFSVSDDDDYYGCDRISGREWANVGEYLKMLHQINLSDIKEEFQFAKKESEGKLYYELDFEFIKQMAERMQSNKNNSKYDVWNWKKPMTPKGIDDLKQAMLRHIISVMEGNFNDDNRDFGHLEAISNNAMMINYQLKIQSK